MVGWFSFGIPNETTAEQVRQGEELPHFIIAVLNSWKMHICMGKTSWSATKTSTSLLWWVPHCDISRPWAQGGVMHVPETPGNTRNSVLPPKKRHLWFFAFISWTFSRGISSGERLPSFWWYSFLGSVYCSSKCMTNTFLLSSPWKRKKLLVHGIIFRLGTPRKLKPLHSAGIKTRLPYFQGRAANC